MLFHALDDVLGTTTQVQVLRALLPLRGPVSGREVKRLSRARSRSALSRALDHLTALGVVHRRQLAGTHLFQVNREHDLVPAIEALFQAEAARFAAFRAAVAAALEEAGVAEAVLSAVVFGSMARGDAHPESDLDLLVATASEEAVEPVNDALLERAEALRARFGFRISPLVLPQPRIVERFREGDPLMKNILDDGRTLLGASFREVAGAW